MADLSKEPIDYGSRDSKKRDLADKELGYLEKIIKTTGNAWNGSKSSF